MLYLLNTPVPLGNGVITLIADESALIHATLPLEDARGTLIAQKALSGARWRAQANDTLRQAARQLTEYFEGRRTTFDLPLAPRGSPFMKRVWKMLRSVPYGETQSYGTLAAMMGRPLAARAVGAANAANPLAIIVPCHRVLGADGRQRGFGGCRQGLELQRQLLALEGANENAKWALIQPARQATRKQQKSDSK